MFNFFRENYLSLAHLLEAISNLDEKLRRYKQIKELKEYAKERKPTKTSLSNLNKLGLSTRSSRIIPNLNNSVYFSNKIIILINKNNLFRLLIF